jgi:hypothetical protein
LHFAASNSLDNERVCWFKSLRTSQVCLTFSFKALHSPFQLLEPSSRLQAASL